MSVLPIGVYTTGFNLESHSRGIVKPDKVSVSLYKLIWEPLKISKEVNIVYIIPDGVLNRISFNALRIDSNIRSYLLDYHDIYTIGSSRSISDLDTYSLVEKNHCAALLIGGLDFGDIKRSIGNRNIEFEKNEYAYLEYSKTEVDTIRQILLRNGIKVTQFDGLSASKRNVLDSLNNNSKQYKILHFATHSYYLPDSFQNLNYFARGMLNSGIILSNYNKCKDIDCQFRALEISNMDLSGVELVVLSSCESALGDIDDIEGLYGLPRAFDMAGVKKQISAINKVHDEYSSYFMEEFYKNLLKKSFNTHVAFNDTLKIIRGQRFANEVAWSSFILIE
jgi:CHAT domain-containing protein